ncbi:MAG TPA: hypothetical protein VGR12_03665 [Solirubrobacteraceae bacterium]|nr:hypothetical protein [Solirubrobacteraceae bacterium]
MLTLIFAVCALLALPASASATAPWACLDRYDGFMTPVVGVEHEVFALCSLDGDGHDLVLFEWDLDGDGTYERSTGSTPWVAHTWNDRAAHLDATVNVGVKVTDAAGESGTWSEPLRLTDQINSWFTFGPQLVNPGDVVGLDAYIRPRYALDGREWTYEWDLDGDGAYEHSTGPLPDATLVAPDAIGRRPVGLRVTDDVGNVSVVRRNIEVLPRHPSRDHTAYEAPANLADAPVLPPAMPETVAPVGPTVDEVVPRQRRLPRPMTIRRISGSRRALNLTLNGPRSKRFHITVRLPADRAAGYGLPRRRVVFARGYIRFNARGIGRTRMRWTKGAYDVFRRVRYTLVDIVPRPA